MDDTFDIMYRQEGQLLGGIDESGVIDMAGPLVAACVVLPRIDRTRDDLHIFEVNDSKQIPERFRKQYAEIVWQMALGIGIGEVTPQEVDYFGNTAVRIAMTRAVVACRSPHTHLPVIPDFLIIDGTNSLDLPIEQKAIGQGDTKSLSIAAASIVAKVYRDETMIRLSKDLPSYDWVSNKGHHCENQFEGLDRDGIQLGIHRLRSWPFASKEMMERRKKWKEVTTERLFQNLKDQLKDLKQPSSKLLNSLAPTPLP